MSLNLHDSIQEWNKGTNKWLRTIVYERVAKNKTLLTYALSCIWHGFYPGYYLTFTNGAIFTGIARIVRRKIRPHFLGSNEMKFLYDVITFIGTRVLMAYLTFSFILLEFVPSLKVYLHLYLFPHIVGIALVIIAYCLPKLPSPAKAKGKEAKPPQEISNGIARKTM